MDAVKDFPKFVRKIYYDHDITKLNLDINKTQTKILMMINDNKDKSMSEISREVGLEKSSFTRSIDQLIQNGYIKKEYSEKDRRVAHLAITEKGRKAAKLIKKDWKEYFNSLTSILSDNEMKEFTHAVETISKYINIIIEGKK